MSFKILADTFSLARDSSHFVQLKTLKSPRTNDQIWVAFEVEGETKYSRSTIQSLLDTLDEVFFDNLDVDVYDRFENALKEVNLTYKNLKEKRGEGSVGKMNAIIAVFSESELHLTQTGEAEAYLVRKGKLSLISEGLASKSPDLFVNIASGELMPEDKIILATSRLLRLATHTELAQMCKEGVVEALDSLRELVMNEGELSVGITCLNTKLNRRSIASKSEEGSNPVTGFFGKIWDHLMIFVEEKTKGRKLPVKKNTLLIALGVVIAILIISIIFLMDVRTKGQERDEYRTRIDEIREEINEARTEGYSGNKETANNILERAEERSEEILQTEYFREEVLALIETINDTRDNINNTKRLNNLTPYADLSAKRENVEALGLSGLGNKLFAYEYNALYEIIVDEVLDPKVINESENVIKGTSMTDQDALMFLTESGKIIEYSEGEFKPMGTDDETWKTGVDIATYGKFLYLLSPEDNQIYKYTHLRSKFSNASNYNVDGDLEGGISIAIDGSVYVLKDNGEIVKLLKGERQDYIIDNLAVDLKDATQLFTLPEHSNLYVMDPVNKRIIVIQKEGEEEGHGTYKEQIYFEDLDELKGFYVDQNEDKLYVTGNKKIYQVSI